MAISRISDLPEIENIWGSFDENPKDGYELLAKSLVEVSQPTEVSETTGRYLSQSVRVGTLVDYITQCIEEQDIYENTVFFQKGFELSGHVSINDGVPLQDEYSIDVYGWSNSINAATTNTISAGTLVDIKSDNNIDIAADDNINIMSEGDVTTQADGAVYIDAANTVIASSVKTIIAAGSPDNIQVQVDQLSAESKVPFYAPTPYFDAPAESKQVVNVDYLNAFKSQMSADIMAEVIAYLNQGTAGGQSDTSNIDVYAGTLEKLFELKTFDCQLKTEEGTLKKQHLWLLGSAIADAQATVPKAYAILAAAAGSNTDSLPAGKTVNNTETVTYAIDAYGHKVIINPSNNVLSLRERCIESFGAFWYYVIKSDGTLLLPVNNMYFRSGGETTFNSANVGSYIMPSLPKINSITNIIQKAPQGTGLHNGTWQYVVTTNSINLSYSNTDKWSHEDTSGLVAPPSVQTYTYIVCF